MIFEPEKHKLQNDEIFMVIRLRLLSTEWDLLFWDDRGEPNINVAYKGWDFLEH